MSSPSSSIQRTDLLLSQSTSHHENSHMANIIDSNQDLSGSEIFQEMQELLSDGIHYAANKDIASQCEVIFNRDLKGDILVPKETQSSLSGYIFAGVFQIDTQNFFLISDGKWNVNNPLSTQLDQVKPSCHLLSIQRDSEFNFSLSDFPTIISNLCAIKTLANPRKNHETLSVIISDSALSSAIKLTHHSFVICRHNPLSFFSHIFKQ
jgi:hypothetical protein